jgi:hypothetical protein
MKYSVIKDFGRKVFSVFLSAYICEQTTSVMKNRSEIRVRMTDVHLDEYHSLKNLVPCSSFAVM